MRIEIDHPTGKVNFTTVEIGPIAIAFSYATPIGFTPAGEFDWVTRENDWSTTTGKHLNWLDFGHKSKRLSGDHFEVALEVAITEAFGR